MPKECIRLFKAVANFIMPLKNYHANVQLKLRLELM